MPYFIRIDKNNLSIDSIQFTSKENIPEPIDGYSHIKVPGEIYSLLFVDTGFIYRWEPVTKKILIQPDPFFKITSLSLGDQ